MRVCLQALATFGGRVGREERREETISHLKSDNPISA